MQPLCRRCDRLYMAGYAEGQADTAPYSSYREHWIERQKEFLAEAERLTCTCKT